MIAGLGDDGPPITVTHQNHWSAHGVDGGLGVFLVVGVGGLGRLRHRHLVPIILEDKALATPGPVLIEAVVDPLEPPLPANVSLKQAAKFAESLAKGEPNRSK